MSFLQAVTNDRCRAEQLESAWKSLSYDILQQKQKPISSIIRHTLTPPSSPESTAYQSLHSPLSFPTMSSTASRFSTMEHMNYHNESGSHTMAHRDLHSAGNVRCGCCLPTPSPPLHINTSTTDFYRHQTPLKESSKNLDILVEHSKEPILDYKHTLKRKYEETNTDIQEGKKRKTKEEVACQVHGILSLPGCREPRYNITAEELQRRVNQPECLTKVDMISYVRLAKNSARSLLDKHEVKTNQHNQRSEHTVLSKVSEAEAQVLAKGIREINYRYFPGSWFARKSVHEIAKNNPNTRQHQEALLERLKEDEITKCVLLDIYFGLEKRKSDAEMDVFNSMSHTFGVTNLQNHLLFLLSYIEEESGILKKSV